MLINEPALFLAGYVLAHAAWFSADLPLGQRLAPFVVVEQNSERELTRFNEPNQAEAVRKARDFAKLVEEKADAWALARQGIVTIRSEQVDVLVVEYWSRGMREPESVMQKIKPKSRQYKFRIIGKPFVFINGEVQDTSDNDYIISYILTGTEEHSHSAELWKK